MEIYITVVYIVFWLSLLLPIYTYLLYPIVLKLLKAKKFSFKEWSPLVTVINISSDYKDTHNCSYEYPTDKLQVLTAKDYKGLNDCIKNAQGEVLLFTRANVEFSENAIGSLLQKLSDERVGAVCGQLSTYPDESGRPRESLYWKYENIVKRLEGKIGCLSGANQAIFAVKKSLCPNSCSNIISWDFYISTHVLQSGFDVLFDCDAVAFEHPESAENNEFEQHVKSGAGAYQSLVIFWKMLLPRKGSFVHVSHRVMKWLVPFNMIFLLVSSALLSAYSFVMLLFVLLQVVGYLLLLGYHLFFLKRNRTLPGIIGKLLSLAVYFISLNVAWFIGIFKIRKFASNEQL